MFALAQVAHQPSADRASASLSTAKVYLDAGDYPAAEKQLLEALAAAPPGSQIRKAVEAFLRHTLTKAQEEKQAAKERARQKQGALLREAQRLSSEGKFDQASALMQKVLNDTEDPRLIKEAKDGLARAHPDTFTRTYQRYVGRGWVLDFILGILLVILLWISLRFIRWFWSSRQGSKWMVTGIVDNTGLGVGELVIDSLSRCNELLKRIPVSAGLLNLEPLQLPLVPQIEFPRPEVYLTSVVESLRLQIGGVDLGAIAKAIVAICRWMNATRPQIGGIAVISDRHIVVRLTRRGASSKFNTLTASCEIAQGFDAAAFAVEEVSFKMFYLIAKESTISEVEAAEKLRQGLRHLQQYISGTDPKGLQAAYEAFLSARKEIPASNEAYLYEGIALDLMERHDQAINRFHYLVLNASDEKLREKALYNEAISRFRKYRPDDLEDAIEKLDQLVGQGTNIDALVASPTKAIALAAKANAIAHQPIFWQRLLFEGTKSADEPEVLRRKGLAKERVDQWLHAVINITEDAKAVYERVIGDDKVWDELARRQLKWAIQNARGNVYLNYAMNFLAAPHLPEAQEPEHRKEYLEKAYSSFQECEILLPPGVETLTNLATVLLNLSRTDEAREYAQRAIDLNPDYEYAYYRLAQCWDKENWKDKVVQVLKSFAKIKMARIPEFQELYRKYSMELARG